MSKESVNRKILNQRQKINIVLAAVLISGCSLCLNHVKKKNKEHSGNIREQEVEKVGEKVNIYDRTMKRLFDRGLSFIGLVLLAPVYFIIAVAIFIDDPGPILFTQKRVGKNKELFMLHKFRSMKMSTPHDIPTHQLKDPEQYITRVGRILRKTSLDELPQLWDIFREKMSIIGPRPALWNQDDLVKERDKYGANDVLPGLTGWAQINGRDELEIADKAKLDGEYAEKLRQGGMTALFFDAKCFFGTIFSVLRRDGIVEGGTGEMHKSIGKTGTCKSTKNFQAQNNGKGVSTEGLEKVNAEDAGFEDYGYLKHFKIDTSENNKKRVLITGAGSYIGESFERWAKERYPENFTIDTVDMQKADWQMKDFSSYDAVFHVAGIAHADVGKVSEEEKKKYYAVNTDLAIETAKKAKAEGVKQFVLMSSMIVYGNSAPYRKEKIIDEKTVPHPSDFYGDSKWKADKGVRALAKDADDRQDLSADKEVQTQAEGAADSGGKLQSGERIFHVAVLRAPMVYGESSKGNYPVLAKLAKRLPVFPDVVNQRSMLYIDNLCEFLCKLMLSGEGGVYFPQNGEYTKTSEMVRQIAKAAEKKIWITKLLNPAVVVGSHVPGKVSGLVNKAFGNLVYSKNLSIYDGLYYIKKENTESAQKREKVLSDPLVTVITATYNSEKTLAKTIESVLSQTYSNIEYIIVDGLSSDRTVKIAESYKNDFIKKGFLYRVISEKDDGMYDAINKGITLAHGEIIGNINSDDWYEADAVEKTVLFFQKTNCDFMYADLRMVKKDGKSYIKHSRKGKIVTSRNWNHPTQFVKHSVYKQEKYKCESLHDDFDLLLRVKAKNYKIGIMNEVTANFRMDGMSHERNLQKAVQRAKARYRIYRNNCYSRLYWLECFLVEAGKFVFG